MFARRQIILWSLLVGLGGLTGCGELDAILGTEIAGTVYGETYQFVSGTAEARAAGGFVLTLADDPSFDCVSTPMGKYLTIVITGVESTGSFAASGSVSFNVFEDGINLTETATSGTVTIDVLDGGRGVIEGAVDARGPESDVYGSFSVPLC